VLDAPREESLRTLEQAEETYGSAIAGLSAEQLDTPYRPDGWTVRQVIHHVADSHAHAYCRLRFALTEEDPEIKPYNEKAWADLIDARTEDPQESLAIIGGLHRRWVRLLRNLKPEQWNRNFYHPERGAMSIEQQTALYAWHCRHHAAHILGLRSRMNW